MEWSVPIGTVRGTVIRLHPPAEAVLEDAQVGLPRVSGQDHLTAAEAASGAADQPLALQTYTSWAWVEEYKWHGEYVLSAVEIAGPNFTVLGFIENAF